MVYTIPALFMSVYLIMAITIHKGYHTQKNC